MKRIVVNGLEAEAVNKRTVYGDGWMADIQVDGQAVGNVQNVPGSGLMFSPPASGGASRSRAGCAGSPRRLATPGPCWPIASWRIYREWLHHQGAAS